MSPQTNPKRARRGGRLTGGGGSRMRAACALAALVGLGGAVAQPTEVWIGALYPVLKPSGGSTSQDCGGTNRMEAFMMAKDQFNDKTDGAYDTALPDTTLKFIYRDSKRSSEYAVSGATGHMMKKLGPNCETTGECYSVAAIIGPASSGPTMSAQTVLREYGIPQISFSATSPSLANNAAYPTFMRTPPSDAYQAEKTADLMKNVFGWDCVNTVSGTDSYSTAGMKAFKSSAEKVGVRVDYSLTVSSSDSTLKDQVEQMFASTQCAINLLWAQGYDMGRFIGEMHRGNFYGTKEYILWISESGYANAATMLDYSKLSEADFFKVTKGAVMAYYEDLKIKDSPVWQKHKDVWLSLPVPTPTGTGVVVGDATFTAADNVCLTTADDIGVPLYQWDHDQDPSTPNVCAKFNCDAAKHTESSFGGYVAYSYDASVTIMQAIDDLIKSGKRQCQYDEYVGIDPKTGTCFTGLDLYTQMTKQDFQGTTNRVHYVTSGDGVGQRAGRAWPWPCSSTPPRRSSPGSPSA